MTAAWRAVCRAHPAMRTTFVRILSKDILSFFAVELAPSALFEPPGTTHSPSSPDVFENELKADRERGFDC
jgi:hypothetical protein